MVRSPPVNRLPNNAMSENDIIMTQQQAHNLKMAQTASDGFRFPQNTDIVDDDDQTVQDVIAEINAETNRAESTQPRPQMMPPPNFANPPVQVQMQMQQIPQPSQMQPQPPHVQQVVQSPPQPHPQHHNQHQHQQQHQASNPTYYGGAHTYAQSPPPQLPPQPSGMVMMNPYSSYQEPTIHVGGDRNVRVETYQDEKSHINRIIETITSNIKIFLILSIIIVLLRVPVVRQSIETVTRKYIPVPYIEVVVDILLAYIIFLILSSKFT